MAVVSNVEIRVNAKNAIQQFDLLQRKAKDLNGTLDRTKAESQQVGVSLGGLATRVTALVGGVVTLKKGLDAAFARGNAENRLRMLTDSTKEYEAALAFAGVAAKEFGFSNTQALEGFGQAVGRLKNLGFTLGEVNDIYRGFNVVAAQSGVSADASSRAFLQLGQALGSGALRGDELVSIMETMPQLGQKIAQSMGESAGSVKQLASEGKLTTQVIYNALKGISDGAKDFNGQLTESQLALSALASATEDAQVALGQLLAPAYLSILEGITKTAFTLQAAFVNLRQSVINIFGSQEAAVSFAGNLAKIAAAVYIVVKAYKAWQAAVKAAAAAQAALLSLSGPKGWKILLGSAAAFGGALAAIELGLNAVEAASEQATADGQKDFENWKKTIDQWNASTGGSSRALNEVRVQQEAVNAALKQQTALLEQAARNQTTALRDNLSLAEARYGTEKQLLSNQIQQAQAAGNSNKVYRLKVELARLDYDIAVQRINAEVRKLELAQQLARAKARELEIAVLQTAEGSKEEARLRRAVALQLEAVKQASTNLSIGRQLADEQIRGAKAVRDGAIAAAKAARSAEATAKATQAAAESAGRYASDMERGANAANKGTSAIRAGAVVLSGTISVRGASKEAIEKAGGTEQFNSWKMKAKSPINYLRAWNKFANKVLEIDKALIESGETRTVAYASGGYVSSPTNAVIGEGGSEYVIPASKMSAAMERYAAGKRGNEVVPNGNDTQVNVSTGPVMQMNGQNYVTQSDFEKGLRSTVNQVMTTLRRSPNTRAAVGI